jgi:hypothetical protein
LSSSLPGERERERGCIWKKDKERREVRDLGKGKLASKHARKAIKIAPASKFAGSLHQLERSRQQPS